MSLRMFHEGVFWLGRWYAYSSYHPCIYIIIPVQVKKRKSWSRCSLFLSFTKSLYTKGLRNLNVFHLSGVLTQYYHTAARKQHYHGVILQNATHFTKSRVCTRLFFSWRIGRWSQYLSGNLSCRCRLGRRIRWVGTLSHGSHGFVGTNHCWRFSRSNTSRSSHFSGGCCNS